MKRSSVYVLGIAMAVLLAACAVDKPADTELFVIADTDGRSLSHYEYLAGTDRLVGTATFDGQHRTIRRTEYEYDAEGNTARVVTTEPTMDGVETRVRSYATREERDADGRLVKVTRTASDGEVVETFYGYDETGALRGVVQRYPDGSLEMMDY